jgi:hypothetical protein
VFAGWSGAAAAEEYWLELHQTLHLNEATAVAETVHPNWVEGGRLAQVMIRKSENCGSGAVCYRVHVGVYSGVVRALKKGIEILQVQPWTRTGFASPSVNVVLGGSFARIPMRFTAALAKACRKKPNDKHPVVAETVCARSFGYARPEPSVPALERSTAAVKAWDRALVTAEKELCMDAPRIVGGPPPRYGPGKKLPGPPQVHTAGKRCLRWLQVLTERELKLAWFPAACLVPTHTFRKAVARTRWGPARYRFALNRVGRLPAGILYEAVFRTGAFAPKRIPVTVADKFPEPHRLGWDRLGPALFEGRGLIVMRLKVRPPSPKISPLWKRPKRMPHRYRYRPRTVRRRARRGVRRVVPRATRRRGAMQPVRRRGAMQPVRRRRAPMSAMRVQRRRTMSGRR